MLVLSRRTNETLVIADNIRFTVLSIHGNQVRIGIEAPDDIIILREEIIDNTRRAATHAPYATAALNTQDNAVSSIKTEDLTTSSTQAPQHTRGNQHGSEQGKRRGVLGLRRRRP